MKTLDKGVEMFGAASFSVIVMSDCPPGHCLKLESTLSELIICITKLKIVLMINITVHIP